MLRTTLTAAWSRKRRLIGTAFAIVLGVAFLSATLVIGDSARAGFTTAFGDANAGTDAYVRSAQELTAAEEPQRPPIDAALISRLAAIDGVRAVVPAVEGTGQALDAEGAPIGGEGPPTVAAGWIEDPSLTGWDLAEGRAPVSADEVVVDRGTAVEAGVDVGDPLTMLVPDPVETTVVGIATFGDRDSIGGATYIGFATAAAQELLLGSRDLVSGVVVAAQDGVSQEELVARVEAALPGGVEAVTGEALTQEQLDAIESDFLGFFTTALLAFALVALAVAAFSIFNTFSILVAQRTGESALLRALGASRRQVLASALIESSVVGVVGAVAGAGAGVLIAGGMLALMDSAGFGLPTDGLVVNGGALSTSVLVGLAVTVVGGFLPAWRASRVAPLAALRDVAVDATGVSMRRAIVGGIAAGVGALIVIAAGDDFAWLGLGALVLLVGVVVLGPVVARPVGHLVGAPVRLRGVSGDLARRNAVRNPRRTAATATALLVGVGVVSMFAVFGASMSASIEQAVDRSFGGELALTPPGGWSGAGLSTELLREVEELPEVEAAAGLGYGAGTLDGRQKSIGFSDPQQLASVAQFELIAGDIAAVDDAHVALSGESDHAVGDVVEVGFPDGTTETLTVAATFNERGIGEDVLVTETLWSKHANQPSYYLALVGLADGVDLDAGRAAVEAATAGPGAPDVMDRDEFVEGEAAEIDALLTVIYALLAVAIVIALMGIANTMSLAIHERTRELGLLRAVGQTRSQLRAMVRWESVIVATFGSIGGLGLGMFLSWGLVRAMNASEGFGEYAVPFGALATVLAVGAAAGVVAGLRPAWRASRLDVLDAVATE